MIPVSAKTQAHIAELFAPTERADVKRLLEEFCADSVHFAGPDTPESLERVRFAALKVSEGNLDALCRAIDLAATDWRDLLVAADFANDVTAHQKWSPESKWRAG